MSRTGSRSWGPRWRMAAVALVSVAGIGASISGMADTGSTAGTSVVAQFADASPLLVGNDVKINGVKVGEVTGMSVVDGRADVGLSLDRQALPLHSDARLTIRPVSLLGERFVDLDRGSSTAPLLGAGGVIPLAQTSQATDLDQVLNTLDDKTGSSLAALVTMLGQGMQGNGANIDATVKALGPAMTDTGGLMKILNQQNALLNRVVDNFDPVAQALAADGGRTMDGLVASAQQLFGTTAANQRALEDSLAQLPETLNVARTTLAQLAGTATATAPTLRAIRPVTDNLAAISQELQQFSSAADPALARTQPVLLKAQAMLDAARPVSEELLKAGPDLRSASQSLNPLVNHLADNITNVLNFIRYWALTTNGSDGVSYYFRALAVISPYTLTGTAGLGGNLGVGGSRPVPGPDGQGGQPAPGAPGAPPGPLPGLLSPLTSPDGSVTGLTQQQEGGVLQFLLGGI